MASATIYYIPARSFADSARKWLEVAQNCETVQESKEPAFLCFTYSTLAIDAYVLELVMEKVGGELPKAIDPTYRATTGTRLREATGVLRVKGSETSAQAVSELVESSKPGGDHHLLVTARNILTHPIPYQEHYSLGESTELIHRHSTKDELLNPIAEVLQGLIQRGIPKLLPEFPTMLYQAEAASWAVSTMEATMSKLDEVCL